MNIYVGVGIALVCAVLLIIVYEGPRRANEKCLARGGDITVGRESLCFDKEGRYVR